MENSSHKISKLAVSFCILINLCIYAFFVWVNVMIFQDPEFAGDFGSGIRAFTVFFIAQAIFYINSVYKSSQQNFENNHLLRAVAYGGTGRISYVFYLAELGDLKYELAKKGKIDLWPNKPTTKLYVSLCWLLALGISVPSIIELIKLGKQGFKFANPDYLQEIAFATLIGVFLLIYSIFETRKLFTKKKNPLDNENPVPVIYGILTVIFVILVLAFTLWYGQKINGTKIFDF